MPFDYAEARETAENIITNFGQAGTFTLRGDTGGYDENGDVIAPSADTVITGTITPLLRYKKHEIDGESIRIGDNFVFFHSTTAPTINMQTTVNSESFRVVKVEILTSVDDINVYRKIQLRQ